MSLSKASEKPNNPQGRAIGARTKVNNSGQCPLMWTEVNIRGQSPLDIGK